MSKRSKQKSKYEPSPEVGANAAPDAPYASPNLAKSKKPLIISLLLLIILSCGVAVGYGLWQRHNNLDSNKPKDTSALALTSEQEHTIEHVRRIDGKVLAASKEGIKLQLSGDKAKTLDLKLTKSTKYSKGYYAALADRSDLLPNQDAVVGYDDSNNTVISVWINFKEELKSNETE